MPTDTCTQLSRSATVLDREGESAHDSAVEYAKPKKRSTDIAACSIAKATLIRCRLRVRDAPSNNLREKEPGDVSTHSASDTFFAAKRTIVGDTEQNVRSPPNGGATRFNMDLNLYKRRKKFVRLDQLVPLPFKIRDSDPKHISALYHSFLEQGYEPSHGLIHVAHLPSLTETVTTKFKADGFPPQLRCAALRPVHPHPTCKDVSCTTAFSVLDGRHRNGALLLIVLDHARDYSVLHRFTWIQVMEWSRHDGMELSSIEALAIGSRMNQTTKLVKRISFMDNLTVSLSFAQGFSSSQSEDQVSIKYLADSMHCAQILSMESSREQDAVRKYTRFARIALFLCDHPKTLDTIRYLNGSGTIGITHLQATKFLTLKDPLIINTVLEALYEYLHTPCNKDLPKKGRFEPPRDNLFVDYAVQLITETAGVAKLYGLDGVAELMSYSIAVRGIDTACTIRECFRSYARVFRFVNEDFETYSTICNGLVQSYRNLIDGILRDKHQNDLDENVLDAVSVAVELRKSAERTMSKTRPRRKRMKITKASKRGITPLKFDSSDEYSSANDEPKGISVDPSLQVAQTTSSPQPTTGSTTSESHGEEDRDLKAFRSKDVVPERNAAEQPSLKPQLVDAHEDSATVLSGSQTLTGQHAKEGNFDDRMPSRTPRGFPKLKRWAESTVFGQYAELPPSMWKDENHIRHTRVWATAICLGPKHRSAILLSADDCKEIHERVYWHSSLSYIQKIGILGNEFIRQSVSASDSMVFDDASKTHHNTQVLAAKRMDWYSTILFAEKSQHLLDCGYCILEGFLDDRRLNYDVEGKEPEFERFICHMYGKFPGEESFKARSWKEPPPWYPIINLNTVQDTEDQREGIGRFMTSRKGVVDDLENGSEEERKMAIIKARVEARLGQIAVALRLNIIDGKRIPLKTPNTGMRLLLTGRNCPRQVPHIDFPAPEYDGCEPFRARKCVSYAMLHTGRDSGSIGIFVDSHRYSNGPQAEVARLSRSIPPLKVDIPPYSVLVLRGDVYHGGLGYNDETTVQRNYRVKTHSVRGHMYLTLWEKSRFPVSDAIHFGSEFSPSWPTHPLWKQDLGSTWGGD